MTDLPGLHVGLFGIGLDAYWPQFSGLEDRLKEYINRVAARLQSFGADVVNLGLIDTPQKAMTAGHRFRQADVDLIFLYVTTYALSSTVLPVVRRARVPVVVLNLSPGRAIDYAAFNQLGDRMQMTGEWLAWCQACPVPEIANVFTRARIPFFQVTGVLENDDAALQEVEAWVTAARAAHVMEHNRLGLVGHYYSGMLDIYSDLTTQCATFSGHIEILEMDELTDLRQQVTPGQIGRERRLFSEQFDIRRDCSEEELERAARTSIALRQFVEAHQLGSMAYYYRGTRGSANEDTISSIILGASLMTARGVPMAGEYEVKNAQAMKIMNAFDAGGSYSEYYAVDYNDDVVLMGHDGPGHPAIAEGKIRVRPLAAFHGKVGRGLSVEMSVRHGPVTLLSVVEGADGQLRLLYAEGESVPGPILEIGNTNSRYRFAIGARRFISDWNARGPAHHCAIGVGHVGGKIEKLAAILGIAACRVC